MDKEIKRTLQEILHSMICGEEYFPNDSQMFKRVPGGWIYGNMQGNVFIPYDNEFKPEEETKIPF